MEKEYTERGFRKYGAFEDNLGTSLGIQESSSVYGGIWLYLQSETDRQKLTISLSIEDMKQFKVILEEAIEHQENSGRIWKRAEKAVKSK